MRIWNPLLASLAVWLVVAVANAAPADPPAPDRSSSAASEVPASGKGSPEPAGAAADEPPQVASAERPVYVPPRRGAPKTRVGGGTRSGGASVRLALLAPEHTGLTASASPTLYWWLSEDHAGEFELVVTRWDAVEPELRVRRSASIQAGVHAFDLASEGLELAPGVAYQWSVAIVRDPDRRSRDIVAVATLEFDPTATGGPDPAALASAGLWYDAINVLSAGGDRAQQRRLRAALLEQVALPDVARWDRQES